MLKRERKKKERELMKDKEESLKKQIEVSNWHIYTAGIFFWDRSGLIQFKDFVG